MEAGRGELRGQAVPHPAGGPAPARGPGPAASRRRLPPRARLLGYHSRREAGGAPAHRKGSAHPRDTPRRKRPMAEMDDRKPAPGAELEPGEGYRPGLLDGFKRQLPDADPIETQEWIEALDGVVRAHGRERADFLAAPAAQARAHAARRAARPGADPLHQHHLARAGAALPRRRGDGAPHPAHRPLERRGHGAARQPASRPASAATSPPTPRAPRSTRWASTTSSAARTTAPGDQVFFQGHAAPGIYARAFLEGRISEQQLDHFRREVGGQGLSSYPHPRLMPDCWEFPTVSMGLGPLNAIYQARFNRYLHARGFADTSKQRVWAFLGDGEMDEPEALGALTLAGARGARQPDLRRQLQPAAPRRPGARQRQDHPGAGGALPRRRLERHQGHLGPRVGRRCWRATTTACWSRP